MNNISQRDAFWNRLYELAKIDSNIVVVAADMGAPALDKFRRDLSSQFLNVGIAEQQAVLVAAGMALGGKKVFAYAIAPFISLRCYEQTRLELAAMNIPVTLVGIGAGFSYDDSGPTHHTVDDISVMRSLPNLRIHTITDSVMAAAYADISCNLTYPNYIRFDRETLPEIYKKGADFSSGMAVLKKGKDAYLIATGNMVHRALEVSEILKEKSVDIGVIDLYTLPINESIFLGTVDGVKRIVTLEEHSLPGGMGSAVCEVMSDNKKLIPVRRLGLKFENGYCYKYGGRKNIQSLYGLDRDSIVKSILEFNG